MKIEPNMYVRTKKGIAKIVEIFDKENEPYYGVKYRTDTFLEIYYDSEYIGDEDISKASHNIIDLIEVGDVITFKNDEDVYRVSCVPNEESACDCFYLVFNYATQYGVEDIEVSKETMQNTLESVITREQFEKIAYKVGD